MISAAILFMMVAIFGVLVARWVERRADQPPPKRMGSPPSKSKDPLALVGWVRRGFYASDIEYRLLNGSRWKDGRRLGDGASYVDLWQSSNWDRFRRWRFLIENKDPEMMALEIKDGEAEQ